MVDIVRTKKSETEDDHELESRVTVIKTELNSQAEIASSSVDEAEAIWEGLYFHPKNAKANKIIPPPYDPLRLQRFIETNNTLNQCISAYEVNIAGTGYKIEPKDPENAGEAQEEQARDVQQFFDEVFPCINWTQVNRAIRRDQESMGNGYLEVMRNVNEEIVFMRNGDSARIRLVRMDEPIPVEVTLCLLYTSDAADE